MDYSLTPRQAKGAAIKIWTGPKALTLIPLLIGDAGVSKSAVLLEGLKEIGLDAVQLFLAQSLPEELVGIVDKDRERNLMRMLQPEWTDGCAKKGYIFDEINRADVQTRNAMMQVPLYRMLHLFTFPETTRFAAAMNPDGSIIEGAMYQVEGMDRALETRFVPIMVRPDMDEWIEDFATPRKVHAVVVEFLKMFPEYFHFIDKEGLPAPSPRSWERVSDLVHTGFTTMPFFYRHLGIKAGTVFCKFVKDRFERLTINEMLEDYDSMREKIKNLTPSMAGDIMAQVAAYINEKGVTQETTKLLKKLMPDLKPDFRLALGSKIEGTLINQFIKDKELLDLLFEVIKASKNLGKKKEVKETSK